MPGIRVKPLATGVECNMVILSEDAINAHYDTMHFCDRMSRTPIDRTYARIEQERQRALAIFRHEHRLRVYKDYLGWRLIKGGRWDEV